MIFGQNNALPGLRGSIRTMAVMNRRRLLALAALASAGLLWGATVPLTKLALGAVPPGWLAVLRFALAALPLLLWARIARPGALRAAAGPGVLAGGALGYGVVVVVQNAGIARTSVSHAALLLGTVPLLVAAAAHLLGRSAADRRTWAGLVLATVGIAGYAGAGGGGALAGDLLVGVSALLSAGFTVAQPGVLAGRDPVAVTGVQFTAAAAAGLPLAWWQEGSPARLLPALNGPGATVPLAAVLALVLLGTLAPYTLFAAGQARVPADTAAGFLNLEPLVGGFAGAFVFGDPYGALQAGGSGVVLAGIVLAAWPRGAAATAGSAGGDPGRLDGGAQRPVQVGPQVLDVLDTDREPAQRGADDGGVAGPAGPALDQRLHPAEAGGVGDQPQRRAERLRLLRRPLGLEREHRAEPAGEHPGGPLVPGVAGQPGVADRADQRVRLQPAGQLAGRGLGPVEPDAEGAQAA